MRLHLIRSEKVLGWRTRARIWLLCLSKGEYTLSSVQASDTIAFCFLARTIFAVAVPARYKAVAAKLASATLSVFPKRIKEDCDSGSI